jgi:Rhodopirellula transposase DDE domain
VQLISATTTNTGLSVACRIDDNLYPKAVAVSEEDFGAINLTCDEFHGEWNYTIAPSIDNE